MVRVRVPTSLVNPNFMYFPGKSNENQGQFCSESVCVDTCKCDKDINQIYFCK